MQTKASLPLRILNVGVALAGTWVLLVTSMIMFSRAQHEETSRWVYGMDTPLMNSAFLDFLVNPAFGVFLILFAILTTVKEAFLGGSVRKRALINIGILIVSALVFAILSQSLITPSIATES